jgi:energy-coupling factor transporter ATP-binding protein EcfA2
MPEILYRIESLRLSHSPRGTARGGGQAAQAGCAVEIDALALEEGQVTVLVGPNGSGKTTLLKAMNGLLRPQAGRILYRGEEASASAKLRAESVYLHQAPYMMAGSVSYNVAFGPRTRGLGRREAASRAAEAMAALGLEGFGRRGHRALSGGEAQRVGLARAVATGASVLLLDEPTASVDLESRSLVVGLLKRLAGRGATLVVSTHDDGLASLLGARKIALEAGRMSDEGRCP